MKSKIDSWSTSISTILEKTEKNLNLHRRSQPSLFHKNPSISPESKILLTESHSNPFFQDEPSQFPLQEFYQFRSFITERLTMQSLEFDKIKRKLSIRERPNNDLEVLREDFNFSLNAIEKRCLGEVKKLVAFVNGLGLDEFRKKDQESFARIEERVVEIERKNQDLEFLIRSKSGGFGGGDGEICEDLKKYLKVEEFCESKAAILREVEKVGFRVKDECEGLGQMVGILKEGMNKDLKKLNEKLDKNLKDFTQSIEDLTQKFEDLSKTLHESIPKSDPTSALSDLKKNFDKTQKQIQALQDSFHTISSKIPEHNESKIKSEILNITNPLSSKQDSLENLFNLELSKIQEALTILQNSSIKPNLESLSSSFNQKLENLKSLLATKSDFEKFRKQVIKKFQSFEPNSSPIKGNEKISDSVISKLVQLEQRVSLLEDFSETESNQVQIENDEKFLKELSSYSDLCKSKVENNESSEKNLFCSQVFENFIFDELETCIQVVRG